LYNKYSSVHRETGDERKKNTKNENESKNLPGTMLSQRTVASSKHQAQAAAHNLAMQQLLTAASDAMRISLATRIKAAY